MLHSIKLREEGRLRPPQQPPTVTPRQTPIRPAQPTVYNRYDQERFNRQKEGKHFHTMIHSFWQTEMTEFLYVCKFIEINL